MNVNGKLDVGNSIFSFAGAEKRKKKNDGITRNPAAFVSVRAYTRSCFSVNVGGCLCEGVEVFLDDTV